MITTAIFAFLGGMVGGVIYQALRFRFQQRFRWTCPRCDTQYRANLPEIRDHLKENHRCAS